MQLQHEFTVPLPPDQAWDVLLDVERIAPCMPGARVDGVEGDVVSGQVRVKVGPIQVTYRGSATFVEKDPDTRTVRMEADGKEARGTGTAKAVVQTRLHAVDTGTRVTVETDLAVTGRPAQFGRGVMADVGAKIIGRFAECLAERLGEQGAEAGAEPPATEPARAVAPAAQPASGAEPPVTPSVPVQTPSPVVAGVPEQRRAEHRPTPEVIDLMDLAGGPVLRRLAPVAGLAAVLAFLWWWLRRD